MQGKIYSYYKDLPQWAKGVVLVGVLGGTYILGSQLVSRIKQDAAKRKAEADLQNAKKELKDLQNNGVQTTFPQSQFNAWASQIQQVFAGCDFAPSTLIFPPDIFNNSNWSGSGALIANIIWTLKNDMDFLTLVDTYGVRTYDQCGITFGFGSGDFTGNLYQAVYDELDLSEIRNINKLLAQKNIKYRF